MQLPDKRAVLAALDTSLLGQIDAATARARAIAESAVHEEARSEDSHDTRATEESYLARGQAQRVADLEMDRATLRSLVLQDFSDGRPIAGTALVALEDEDEAVMIVLLAPSAGGQTVVLQGVTVRVVTPSAPLAQALLGKEEGDDVAVRAGRTAKEYVIAAVS
ncbi:MAG: GreA/GreB family elongation factor [Deltaproteobacteria bacterium]|nr:GreA/GreB family elongation factor [Deltaproteobacteria bacterium]